MSKISKTMKAELIAEHFAEQGKRLTNLKRVDVSKLDELILKHSIDIERLQKKLARTAEIEKEARIQREKERDEKQRIYMEECKAKEEERLRLWNSITEAQQLIICEKLVVRANEDGQNKYDADIVHTNALERKAITAGSRVVREGPTTLRINGLIVQTGYDFTPQTKEDWFSNMPQSFVHMDKYSYEFVLPDIEKMNAEKLAVWSRSKAEIVRPTYNLNKIPAFNTDYTLFRHQRGGFCHYAVYNNVANHYVYCAFDGNEITTNVGREGAVYPTLNAFTTANWAEQRKKDGNNKTTRNNAYRETQFRPLQMIDDDEMIYGIIPEKDWASSMSIER